MFVAKSSLPTDFQEFSALYSLCLVESLYHIVFDQQALKYCVNDKNSMTSLSTLVVGLDKLVFFLEFPPIDIRHVMTNCGKP